MKNANDKAAASETRGSRAVWISMLAAGCAAIALLRVFQSDPTAACILSIVWPFCILYAVYAAHTRAQKWITAAAFTAVMVFRYLRVFYGEQDIRLMTDLASVALAIVTALMIFGIMRLSRAFLKKLPNFAGLLFLPSAFLCIMLIMENIHFSDSLLFGVGQFFNPVLRPLAGIIGYHGVTFILLLLINAIVFMLYGRSARKCVSALIVCAVFIIAGAVYGAVRNKGKTEGVPVIRVALATGTNTLDNYFENDPVSPVKGNLESIERLASASAANGADLLVFSEEAYGLWDTEHEQFKKAAGEISGKYRLPMLVGEEIAYSGDEEAGNRCFLTDGNVVAEYDKNTLVPFVENEQIEFGYNGQPQNAKIEANGREINTAFSICYEYNYARYIMIITPDTELLLAPSWDWDTVARAQTAEAGFRAVENGIPIVKSTMNGYMFAVDAFGNVLCEEKTGENEQEHLTFADVPLNASPTVYSIIGETLELLYPILLAAVIAVRIVKGRKKTAVG